MAKRRKFTSQFKYSTKIMVGNPIWHGIVDLATASMKIKNSKILKNRRIYASQGIAERHLKKVRA